MKLKTIYLLSLLACAGLVVKAQTGQRPLAIAEVRKNRADLSVLEKDKQALEKNISKEILSNENWIKINDYSLPVKELVNLNNSTAIFQVSKLSVNDLSRCLKKDFCGMERKDANDSYFDETKTPGHILLGRNLEILRETLTKNPELSIQVDWDVIRELSDSENEKVQVLAIDLLKKFNSKEGTTDKLFKIVDNYNGKAKADALVEISSDNSEEAHNQLLNYISKSFSSDDPNTAMSVLEKLPQMHISQREMEMVANYLCHYKEQGSEEHNWKMIKYQMGKYSISMDTVCP